MPTLQRAWLAAIASAFMMVSVQAQTPAGDNRITLVVPIAPGGGVDAIGRLIAEKLQERLGQPVVVENRVGAGGAVGADSVAKAAPDGRTLLLIESSSTLHKWLHKNVPFDVIADFAPVSRVATTSLLLFANPSFAPNNPGEVVAYAKANPGKVSVGTPGIGTPHHLAALMMNSTAKVDITHVPYRGTGPSLNDLLGGQIPMIWAAPIAVMPHVASGKVKALGTASAQREASLPQVPTMEESGMPGFRLQLFFGVAAPAKTPAALVERLDKEIKAVTALPEVKARMAKLGFQDGYADSATFRQQLTAEHNRNGEIIRAAGIKPN
ncbi:MAG: Bug family tripartite tricarboxylate transporter substrate binding protein [Pseudolabrys sp.]